MRHPSQGTWFGITRSGRLAALTNFREESEDRSDPHPVAETSRPSQPARSRGEITKAYLTSGLEPAVWAERFFEEQENGVWGDMGGFSLLFGQIVTNSNPRNGAAEKEKDKDVKIQLGVLSNRTKAIHEITWLVGGPESSPTESKAPPAQAQPQTQSNPLKKTPSKISPTITTSLSNSHFADKTWPKTSFGEMFMHELIYPSPTTFTVSTQPIRLEILDTCFHILSSNTMPTRDADESWGRYSRELRNSIFIPPIEVRGTTEYDNANPVPKPMEKVEKEWYGTQEQTVMLVDWDGMATFVERTLKYVEGRRSNQGQGERMFKFEIASCVEFLRDLAGVVSVFVVLVKWIDWVSFAILYMLCAILSDVP